MMLAAVSFGLFIGVLCYLAVRRQPVPPPSPMWFPRVKPRKSLDIWG